MSDEVTPNVENETNPAAPAIDPCAEAVFGEVPKSLIGQIEEIEERHRKRLCDLAEVKAILRANPHVWDLVMRLHELGL